MTLMLASVVNRAEAELMLASGVDMIDLKDPAKGALGALDRPIIEEIVAVVAGRKPVSAVAGEDFASAEAAVEAARGLADAGADYVKLGLPADGAGTESIRALATIAGRTKLVGVLFADQSPDFDMLKLMAEAGFAGAMLDTSIKGQGRLLDHMDVAAIALFVERCRAAGLLCGLAGSLEAPDVPRLIPLRPDYLGFRGSLCRGGDRGAALDPAAVAMIRDLIPHVDGRLPAGDGSRVDWRLLGRGYIPANEGTETDRIFVHDFVVPCSIGVYEFERSKLQDVRFNIDVGVVRERTNADDMRDVFSYDLVIDAIKIITGRGHIELIETVAREIADAALSHPSVVNVCVRVEKLDVIRGTVGVEIRRERASEIAALDRLFPAAEGAAAKGSRSVRDH